jgi:hypothetical protein
VAKQDWKGALFEAHKNSKGVLYATERATMFADNRRNDQCNNGIKVTVATI